MGVKKFIFASIMAQTGIKIASKVAEKPFTSPHHQQNCKFHVAETFHTRLRVRIGEGDSKQHEQGGAVEKLWTINPPEYENPSSS